MFLNVFDYLKHKISEKKIVTKQYNWILTAVYEPCKSNP